MAWSDVRSRLVTVLGAVSITSPIAETITKVYDTPPPGLQDLPAFVIFPPARSVRRGSAGRREKVYTVRCTLFVTDADLDQAADIVDAYAEAVIDAFDTEIKLNRPEARLEGQEITEPSGLQYPRDTGDIYTGFDCILTIIISEAKNFS